MITPGAFMPGFVKWDPSLPPPETGLQYVDHCVGNVGWNQMNPWVKFYEDVMGFRNILTFDDKDISTEYSALDEQGDEQRKRLREISDQRAGRRQKEIAGGRVSRVSTTAKACSTSPIATNDIVKTVTELQKRGVEFLKIPSTYYDTLPDRVGHIDEDLEPLKRLGILVDRDNEGYLLQIFTKPVEDRPTLFLRSSSAKARRVSAKAISKRSSKRSSRNRTREAICRDRHA